MYEVYHFEEQAKYDREVEGSGLFTEYVDMFLKGKQEASGWPSADMSTAEKDEYVTEYEKVEGVVLDKEAIKYNSGKRATNKLLLNSFWGKFGLHPRCLLCFHIRAPRHRHGAISLRHHRASAVPLLAISGRGSHRGRSAGL